MDDPLARYRVDRCDVPAALAERGMVLLDGMGQPAELLEFARSISVVVPHRDSGPDGVTTITNIGAKQVRSGFAGFTAGPLQPHTDRAGVADPPALLMTSCGKAAVLGGDCLLIDGRAVYDDLAESEPDALRVFCSPRSVLFGGAAGYLGSIFADAGGGQIAVRLRLDDLAQFSPEVSHKLPVLRAAMDRHVHVFKLAEGQGYVLNNRRWLHGRRAFIGQRVVYRVNANPLPWLKLPAGFRPHQVLTPTPTT